MLLLGEKHNEIGELIAAELAQVETRFAAELVSELPCVNDLVIHLERYRGKMLRPMLTLICGQATDPARPLTDSHRTVAAVVEMVHMATLVHDDVLDEQDVRRKGATISHLRGNEAAVMLGDYLISHAYHLCSSLDSQSAARRVAHTTNTLCEGELLQLANRNNWSLDEMTYFDIVDRKTASLCGIACALGAEFAGAEPVTRDTLEAYGRSVGTAFQIVDDVLDLTGDPDVVGKSLGKDLEKGKLTLPLIHRLETAPPADRQKLLDLLRNGADDQFNRVIQLLADSDSVAYAQNRAQRLIDDAIDALKPLPDSPAKDLLTTLAQMVTARDA